MRKDCSRELNVYGMAPGSITWTSITGIVGQYDYFLNSTSIRNPIFSPDDTLTLPYIDYRVCGAPYDAVANCGYVSICDTMRVYVFPELSALFSPSALAFCDIGPGSGQTDTATVSGGISPYSYQWFDPLGNPVSTADTVFASLEGNYT